MEKERIALAKEIGRMLESEATNAGVSKAEYVQLRKRQIEAALNLELDEEDALLELLVGDLCQETIRYAELLVGSAAAKAAQQTAKNEGAIEAQKRASMNDATREDHASWFGSLYLLKNYASKLPTESPITERLRLIEWYMMMTSVNEA